MPDDIYHQHAKSLDGRDVSMADYRGKVLLIVNVASKCGFTPQYTGLEEIYQRFKDKGFEVLGFPCNQFNKQEPGNDAEIATFCSLTYPVSFPMFSKIEVNGEHTHPLYQQLKTGAPGLLGSTGVKWNFTKFLVNREGEVVERFAPQVKPEDIAPKIAKLLA
ncbi:glutathione peroxidase [Sandaracinobacteroides hominis]|uniref:glutathione peroxidase n=1 Tax=Sandaracinobacteroides hominis TaxID=2780086 RepID=UPI0018F5DC75|nr:glutathione peroxidase [Sandaracinobacteroides hominis]